ncbi:MAG: ComEC family competence protein [Odoribacteraceae bacterium]|jgi:competence protein ComEC|nr:ComEC family competence protein [Odoribacteraceae bacterium]
MFTIKYPSLLLLIPVVAGITAGDYLSFLSRDTCRVIIWISLACMIPCYYWRRVRWLAAPLAYTFVFTMALSRSRPPETTIVPGEICRMEGRCTDVIRGNRYIVRYQDYNLFVQVNDTLPPPVVGDLLVFPARLYPLKQAVDVHEFDYDQYLKQLDIHFRAVPTSAIERAGHVRGVYSTCQEARTFLNRKLDATVRDTTTRALLGALCLGDRSLVSPRTRALFSESGTIHLLAVSGLHVGIIYVMLHFLLGLVHVRGRVRLACILPALWIFAGITGFSPPTVRAATLIGFVIVGRLLERDYNALNGLCASAFFTLLVSPHLLYSVSFQMSYTAYTGIILVLPVLRVKWKNRLIARGYALFALSVAAQIGTLPLVAYYFHSINLNSVLVNIVAVPLASFLLYAGSMILALPTALASLLAFIPETLQRVMIFLLEQYNRMSIPWRDLYPTGIHLLFFYLLVLLGIAYLKRRERVLFYAFTVALLLFIAYHGVHLYTGKRQQELVIYDRRAGSEVLLNYHGHYTFLVRDDSLSPPPPYVTARRLEAFPESNGGIAGNGFTTGDARFKNHRLTTPRVTLYIADRKHVYPGKANVILVTGNLYPNRLRGKVPATTRVIVDRSNTFSCARSWERWGEQQGIRVEKTINTGHIVIPLK